MNCYPAPLPTKPIQYKDCQYWIDGDAELKPPKYQYFVQSGSKKAVASDQTFDTVVEANGAARRAIDSYVAVVPATEAVETATQAVAPTASKRRTNSRSKKS